MIDSINFTIKDIDIVDINFAICDNSKTFLNSQNNYYLNAGTFFTYKGIEFKYYFYTHVLSIQTNAHKILDKTDIKLNDKKEYEEKIYKILSELIVNFKSEKLNLSRIDYCVDLKLDEKIYNYLYILDRYNVSNFKYMKKKKKYKSSIHLSAKQSMRNLNIYSRFEKTTDMQDFGILRIEIQNKNALIKNEFKKFGVEKTLDNYWTSNAMEEFFFNIIKDFCYTQKYYKRRIANNLIDNSTYTSLTKEKLKQFLLDIENKGLENLKKDKNYNHCKIKSRIQKLEELGINPIPLPEDFEYEQLDSLFYIAKKTSEDKYFCSND